MCRRHAFSRSFWGILLAVVAGCSGQPQVFPVHGKLMVGGKPAAGAHLVFHDVSQRIVSRPAAITQADGSFRLMTQAADDGAPAGDYVVTIFWHDDSHSDDDCEHHHDLIQHDRLHGFYLDRTKSPLRASVRPGTNDITIQAIDPSELSASRSPDRDG